MVVWTTLLQRVNSFFLALALYAFGVFFTRSLLLEPGGEDGTGFRNEAIERNKDYGGLEAKVLTVFRNEACESTKVYEQLTK